jgi:hypothetical protein
MLTALRSQAMDRNEAVEATEKEANWEDGSMMASRSWSRQEDGLATAILSEMPCDIADAVSVLLVLHERIERDLIMDDSAPDKGPAGRAAEQAWIATANCISVIAKAFPPKTDMEKVDVRRIDRLRQLWLPAPGTGQIKVLAEGEAA